MPSVIQFRCGNVMAVGMICPEDHGREHGTMCITLSPELVMSGESDRIVPTGTIVHGHTHNPFGRLDRPVPHQPGLQPMVQRIPPLRLVGQWYGVHIVIRSSFAYQMGTGITCREAPPMPIGIRLLI